MDWNAAHAAGVTHAYIKASDGGGWVDPKFKENWQGAKDVGIQRGAYHYYRNHVAPLTQAALFLEQLGDDVGEMPPALDVEDTGSILVADHLLIWLEDVESKSGARPVIYTAKWYWDEHVTGATWASYYKLWVAHYTDSGQVMIPKDWNNWWLWQYSSTGDGELYGAQSTNIDLNRFNRS